MTPLLVEESLLEGQELNREYRERYSHVKDHLQDRLGPSPAEKRLTWQELDPKDGETVTKWYRRVRDPTERYTREFHV